MFAAALLITLSSQAGAALDRAYAGWRLAPAAQQTTEWMREQRFEQTPCVASADLDHDGRPDYAVQIVHHGRQLVIALLARGDSFELHELASDPPDPYTFLLVNRSGTRDFDFLSMRAFRHSRDTLVIMYFEKAPLQFTWRNGRFDHSKVLNDEEIER